MFWPPYVLGEQSLPHIQPVLALCCHSLLFLISPAVRITPVSHRFTDRVGVDSQATQPVALGAKPRVSLFERLHIGTSVLRKRSHPKSKGYQSSESPLRALRSSSNSRDTSLDVARVSSPRFSMAQPPMINIAPSAPGKRPRSSDGRHVSQPADALAGASWKRVGVNEVDPALANRGARMPPFLNRSKPGM